MNYTREDEERIRSYTTIGMIIDPKKREEVYTYYNQIYEETEEERTIFESWYKKFPPTIYNDYDE